MWNIFKYPFTGLAKLCILWVTPLYLLGHFIHNSVGKVAWPFANMPPSESDSQLKRIEGIYCLPFWSVWVLCTTLPLLPVLIPSPDKMGGGRLLRERHTAKKKKKKMRLILHGSYSDWISLDKGAALRTRCPSVFKCVEKKAADMTKDRIDLQQVYYSMQWNQTAGCRKETLAQSSSHLHQDWWCFFAAWCASTKQNCMWTTVYCICTQWLLAPTAANAISDGNEFAVSTDTHLSPPLALCPYTFVCF